MAVVLILELWYFLCRCWRKCEDAGDAGTSPGDAGGEGSAGMQVGGWLTTVLELNPRVHSTIIYAWRNNKNAQIQQRMKKKKNQLDHTEQAPA